MILGLNVINHLGFAMVKFGVLSEILTELLNTIIYTSFCFKGQSYIYIMHLRMAKFSQNMSSNFNL
jgi:hypothetical protein